MAPILTVENVTRRFGSGPTEVVAVKDISFRVAPGEIALIMGPSGSGKTTLLSMLGGLLKPSAGRIQIGPTAISAMDERQLPEVRLRRIAKEENRSVVIVSHDQRIKDIADRVLWLEDGQFKNIVEMALDPVCGMSVDRESAPAHTAYDGRVFYFCAPGCRDEFLQAPERFLRAQSVAGDGK